MQFVSYFGMPLPAIPKGQTGLWLALVGLLFSSMLWSQRVDVIDQKGTKSSTGVVFTEAAENSSEEPDVVSGLSPLEGDLWKNTTNGLLYVYDGTNWKKFNDLNSSVRVITTGSGLSEANPLKIGIYPTEANKEKNIALTEVAVIDGAGSSGQVYIKLEKLSVSYHGKKITIVEDENENPKIITEDSSGTVTTYYDDTAGTNELFMDLTFDVDYDDQTISYNFQTETIKEIVNNKSEKYDFIGKESTNPNAIAVPTFNTNPSNTNTNTLEIKYESVNFIWYMPELTSTGRWIPMR